MPQWCVCPPSPPLKPGWPQGPFRELTERRKGRGWIRSLNLLNHFPLPFLHRKPLSALHCTATQRNDYLSGPQKCIGGACSGLNETRPHMLLCWSAWPPAGETVEEGRGGVDLLEEVLSLGVGFEVPIAYTIPVSSLCLTVVNQMQTPNYGSAPRLCASCRDGHGLGL